MVLANGRQLELWEDTVAPELCVLSLVAGFRGFVAAQSGFWSSLRIHFSAFFFGSLREICESSPSLGAARLWWSWSVCARWIFRTIFFPAGGLIALAFWDLVALWPQRVGILSSPRVHFLHFPSPRRPSSLPSWKKLARGDVFRSGPHFWWS